jgi:collagen type VII alpha
MGVTGATGAAGAAGLNFIGAWNAATNYGVNAGVTFNGSTYIALATNHNAEPDTNTESWAVLAQAGGAGPTGAAGTAATVSVGTVTTLAAGASATVTDTGTPQAAVLNFGIPQGAAGAAGASGSSGAASGGGALVGMYHAVNYATLYYAVNSPNASGTETANVLTWVPAGCTATQLNVYSQQSGSIKVTLRAGATPTSLADTALVCSPATNGSCVATGSVTIAAGEFIDFRFDSASSTLAGVWTALQCQ